MDAPALDTIDGITIVRDDLLPGGTKARVLPQVLDAIGAGHDIVYASPAYGYAQVALAHSAAATGRHAHVFVAERRQLHDLTQQAQDAGATIHQIQYGYLPRVQRAATEYADTTGATLLPFGLDCPEMRDALSACAASLPVTPSEVWCVAGSGTLTRALQHAWPDASHHAVIIGREPDAGAATVYRAPEAFERPARIPPPFPSCRTYDAKAWRYIQQHASPGALFWNVAA
jgi:hypothetical protein